MSKRKYRISGKSFDFNDAKFKSLIENFSKANKISKRKVYMMLTEKLRLAFDSYKSIEKWASTDVGPNSESYFDDIASFFNTSWYAFLNEIQNEKEEKMIENTTDKKINEKAATNVKKFNSVQTAEFLKIKNFILDFLYTYYSSYISDVNEQEKIHNVFGKDFFYGIVGEVAERMVKKQFYINPKEYFTNEELKEIKIAIENQEKYDDIIKRAPFSFKSRLYGVTSEKYEGVSIEEQKFARENYKRSRLLDEYNNIENYGYKIILRQEIDKTLSVLPYEVYKQLINLIDLIPSPNWHIDYDFFEDDENYYNIKEVVPIDIYEKNLKIETAKKEGWDITDENGNRKYSQQESQYDREREEYLKEFDFQFNPQTEQEAMDAFVYSINNRVMNVHKVFFDIMNEYIG